MIVFVAAIVVGGTGAFFSDTETSTGNVFTAGAIDLTVDSEAHYNGSICLPNLETTQDLTDYTWQRGTEYPVGLPCFGTWSATNLGAKTFFMYDDIKPGDEGENTISLHIDSNPAWACIDVNLTKNDDMSSTEPELEVDVQDVPGDLFDGELAQNMKFAAWLDQGGTPGWQGKCAEVQTSECDPGEGDNFWQGDPAEPLLFSNQSGPASDVLGGKSYTLADSNSPQGPMQPNVTNYIGLQWCAGDQVVDTVSDTINCSGANLGNIVQTDSMMANIAFRVEQARHNDNFVCDPSDGGGLACNKANDVMFVLDSSGSIDNTELGVMKTAAKAFAKALAPSVNGNHIGVVDFDDNATLEQRLTDILASIDTAIDALVSGGTTNLGAGITVASTELTSERDRDDVTVAPDFMVIMTDGQPQDSAGAIAAATAAKAAGTKVYVVGIGDGVNATFLKDSISSGTGYYFGAAQFADLENILKGLADCPTRVTPD